MSIQCITIPLSVLKTKNKKKPHLYKGWSCFVVQCLACMRPLVDYNNNKHTYLIWSNHFTMYTCIKSIYVYIINIYHFVSYTLAALGKIKSDSLHSMQVYINKGSSTFMQSNFPLAFTSAKFITAFTSSLVIFSPLQK